VRDGLFVGRRTSPGSIGRVAPAFGELAVRYYPYSEGLRRERTWWIRSRCSSRCPVNDLPGGGARSRTDRIHTGAIGAGGVQSHAAGLEGPPRGGARRHLRSRAPPDSRPRSPRGALRRASPIRSSCSEPSRPTSSASALPTRPMGRCSTPPAPPTDSVIAILAEKPLTLDFGRRAAARGERRLAGGRDSRGQLRAPGNAEPSPGP